MKINVLIFALIGFASISFACDTLLIEAIEKEDLEQVKKLVLSGVNVNERGCDNRTPLIAAASIDEGKDIINFLLNHGADSNLFDNSHRTAYMIALDLMFKDNSYILINAPNTNLDLIYGRRYPGSHSEELDTTLFELADLYSRWSGNPEKKMFYSWAIREMLQAGANTDKYKNYGSYEYSYASKSFLYQLAKYNFVSDYTNDFLNFISEIKLIRPDLDLQPLLLGSYHSKNYKMLDTLINYYGLNINAVGPYDRLTCIMYDSAFYVAFKYREKILSLGGDIQSTCLRGNKRTPIANFVARRSTFPSEHEYLIRELKLILDTLPKGFKSLSEINKKHISGISYSLFRCEKDGFGVCDNEMLSFYKLIIKYGAELKDLYNLEDLVKNGQLKTYKYVKEYFGF